MESLVPDERVDVLVFGAHAPDLRGLRNHVGEHLDGAIGGLHVTGKTVGVGCGVAGASAAKRVFQLQPRAVVHLGTCGIYPGLAQYQPYDVIVATKLVLVDLGVLAGRARWPEPMQSERETHAMMASGLAASGRRAFPAVVACTYAITTDDAIASEIPKRTECHAENLEGFAIAHACHLAEVPFLSVLATTHVIGSGATADWQKYERQATLSAAEVLVSWIHNGAQGLPHGRR
jgi:nucleoside phosphorylase